MSTVTAEFTIRETTLYTGSVDIDTDLWQKVIGEPFDADEVDVDAVSLYVDRTGRDVIESNADIQGQDWTDLDITEVAA